MQHKWFVVVAGVALAWNSNARAGVPGWCNQPGSSEYREEASKDARDNISSVVKGCGPQAGAAWEKAYAAFSNQYSMNEQDWADAAEWVHAGNAPAVRDYEPKGTTLAGLSPVDQYLVFAHLRLAAAATRFGRTQSDHPGFDALYMADALGQNLTEAGRLGLLVDCAGHDGFAVYWASCHEDLTKLDMAKLAAEIRGDKTQPPIVRAAVKVDAWTMLGVVKKADADYAELVKKDDAYKKLLDVATKGRAEWAKQLADKNELLALAQQLDSATYFQSKKQMAGCEEQARKLLSNAASAFPAKTFAGFNDRLDNDSSQKTFSDLAGPIFVADPQMNLAMNAYALCLPGTATGRWFGFWLGTIPGWRGPRNAAFSAITLSTFDLDDTREKAISKPRPPARPYASDWHMQMSWGGVAAKMKPEGDHVVVSQPKSSVVSEDCVKWHETNKIQGWDTAGRLVFQSVCDKYASVKHDTTPDDKKVSATTAASLKPGMRFEALNGAGGISDVVATWPKAGKYPDTLFGAKIK